MSSSIKTASIATATILSTALLLYQKDTIKAFYTKYRGYKGILQLIWVGDYLPPKLRKSMNELDKVEVRIVKSDQQLEQIEVLIERARLESVDGSTKLTPRMKNGNSKPQPQAQKTEPNPNDAVQTKSLGKKKVVPPSGNKVIANQSIDFTNIGTLMEGLTGGQLDAVFAAAVQDAIARDAGGQAKGSDTNFDGQAAAGGLKGFGRGLATGALGADTIPADIQKQIDALNPKQKLELGKML